VDTNIICSTTTITATEIPKTTAYGKYINYYYTL